jgi:hypothetical protein
VFDLFDAADVERFVENEPDVLEPDEEPART